MSNLLGCSIFGITVATIIMPAGSRLIGRMLMMLGSALQSHGDALSRAYKVYASVWRDER